MADAPIADFRIHPGHQVRLAHLPTVLERSRAPTQAHARRLLAERTEHLAELQERLYAHGRYALLLIFQAMDAAGKDSAIKHVMSGVNPQGCQVHSFKQPSEEELGHDFLWRTTCRLPERGRIGIFNRSYYEEVLVVRVHPELLERQRLPEEALQAKHFWRRRMRSIVDFEHHLQRSGTCILKFFLHLSKDEQKARFLRRLEKPDKLWKFSPADIAERQRWDAYQTAYAKAIQATSTRANPWYVIPADDKVQSHLIISDVIIDTLRRLPLDPPPVSAQRRKHLAEMARSLA
jgi:PPK2 family polyphosphate:nucleotide phosphotransferase